MSVAVDLYSCSYKMACFGYIWAEINSNGVTSPRSSNCPIDRIYVSYLAIYSIVFARFNQPILLQSSEKKGNQY